MEPENTVGLAHNQTFLMSRIRNMKSRRQTITFDSIKAQMPDHFPLADVLGELVKQGKLVEKEVTLTVFSIS